MSWLLGSLSDRRSIGYQRYPRGNGYAGLTALWDFFLQREARLEHDLIVVHLAFLHLPAGFHYLKPTHVSQDLVRSLDRGLDRLRDGLLPRTGKLNHLVDMTRHRMPPMLVSLSLLPHGGRVALSLLPSLRR